MKIIARRGNRLHAPENSRIALVSGYTSGADCLELDVQLTADDHLVVASARALEQLVGVGGVISQMKLADLRALNFSSKFLPRGSASYHYFNPEVAGRRLQIETLPELLDFLPENVDLLIALDGQPLGDKSRGAKLVSDLMETLNERDLVPRTVLYSSDTEKLRSAHQWSSKARICAFGPELNAAARLPLIEAVDADGLVTDLESVLGPDGALTDFGRQFQSLARARGLEIGAIVYPRRASGVFSASERAALLRLGFVWGTATDSMLDVNSFTHRWRLMIETDFRGTRIDRTQFSHGYAKANKYAKVYQQDGVHIEIAPYDGPPPPAGGNSLERRVGALEEQMMYVAKDWPFYSGGGLGMIRGIRGDFSAEVDYTVERVAQATTLEMAVLNVDPGAHQATTPTSMRGKDSFYDPHGAPPYVGVEHDEDDGMRINWNLGSEYDNNQYGRPVGDGKALAGRLRLDRRGPYFSAYYRNGADATDWVCVGITRNDSMNPVVYLRCVGKRWRQEDENNPTQFVPIIPNHFVFKNLSVRLVNR